MPAMPRFMRRTGSGEPFGTTNLELFYDLVFVFAITQVSHLLIGDLTWRGAAHAAVALLVVWWAWQYTTWVTNELDPDSHLVQLLLIGLMLASLLMAIAIPRAFGARALLFAVSYVAIQVGRHTFLTFAAAERGSLERDRAERILIWFCAAGVLWIAALAVDYGAPLAVFWVPGVARVSDRVWQVETAHFAERFQLTLPAIRQRNSACASRYSAGPATTAATSSPASSSVGWAITSSSPTAATITPATMTACR